LAEESARHPASGHGRKVPVFFIHNAAIDDWLRQSSAAKNIQNVYLSFSNRNGFYDYVASQLARSA